VPQSVAFAPDDRALAVGAGVGGAGELSAWDVTTRTVRWRMPLAKPVVALSWTPDGKTLLAASGSSVGLFDPQTGKQRSAIGPLPKEVSCLALTPDGKTLATGSAEGTVTLWELGTRKERRSIKAHRGRISSLSFHPEGKLLVSSDAREAALWDAGKGNNVRRWGQQFASAIFTPDGKCILTAGYDGRARLWDIETWDQLGRFGGQGGLRGVLVHEGSRTLILWGFGRSIELFDLDMRSPDAAQKQRIAALIGQLDDDSYEVRQRASRELQAIGWIASSALRKEAKESRSAEVRIRARTALGALQNEALRVLRGHTGDLRAVCISKDGAILASAAADGTVRLWERPTGRQLAVLRP
jgi:WD40 repeat protein